MTALGTYKLDTGLFPTTEQGLEALRVKPADATIWNGPYTEKEIPKDPWGHDYSYRFPGEHGDLPDICQPGAGRTTGRRRFCGRHLQLDESLTWGTIARHTASAASPSSR